MYELVGPVRGWRRAGRPVTVVRLVDVIGMSSRWPGSAVALTTDGGRAGSLLAGAVDGRLDALLHRRGLVSIDVADDEAATVGLSCGGRARVLVQDAADLPEAAWQLLAEHRPVTVETDLESGDTIVRHDDRIGATSTKVVGGTFVAAYRHPIRVVVVGSGLLADALTGQAELLGWQTTVTDMVTELAGYGPGDAVVVLSHDDAVDAQMLANALAAGVGYVGALGSARTQARRAAALDALGVLDLRRIHGPAGLDLGAATPPEIALAVAAELLAVVRDAPATPLRDRAGPIHR